MLNRLAYFLIIIVCIGYAMMARDLQPNEDERASVVMVLGKFPPRFAGGVAMTKSGYQEAGDYTKYSYQGFQFPGTVQSVVNDNGNALLYYLLLSCWARPFGLNIFWMRLLSVVIAGLNLCLLYRLAEMLKIIPILRICLILHTALNPVFFGDALLIRAYMLALTGCLIAALYLWKILSSSAAAKPAHYLIYFLGMLLALGCHYYTVCFFIIQLLPMGRKVWLQKQGRLAWFAGYGVVALACLAWLWRMYPDGVKNLTYFYDTARPRTGSGYEITLANYVKQCGFFASHMLGLVSASLFSKWLPTILCAGLMTVLGFYLLKNRRRPAVLFLLSLTVLVFLLYSLQSVIVTSFTNFIPRYLVIFVPFWMLSLYFVVAETGQTRVGFSRAGKG